MTRLGLLGTLTLVPVFAQSADVSNPHKATGQIARRQHSPIRDRSERGDGTSTSTNWAGYAVTGTSFTSATASWVVPTAVCSGVSGDEYSAFWVGLDGYTSESVEQTGTEADCDGTRANYYAWYEFYPHPSYEISDMPVSPGNHMTASVTYNGSQFTTTITNDTTGKTYTKTASVKNAARTSAEWIAEAPCCTSRGGILPLADFGTGLFGYDYTEVSGTNNATESSHSGAIGSFPATDIEQITKTGSSSSPQTATCSTLSSDGTSFSCTWAK